MRAAPLGALLRARMRRAGEHFLCIIYALSTFARALRAAHRFGARSARTFPSFWHFVCREKGMATLLPRRAARFCGRQA